MVLSEQTQHGELLRPLLLMLEGPLEPGATGGLLRGSSKAFFLLGFDSDLKGDENRTLLLPAVDVVPAGHGSGKVHGVPQGRELGSESFFGPVRVQRSPKSQNQRNLKEHIFYL